MAEEDVTPLPTEEQEEVKSKFKGLRQGLVTVGSFGHLLPPHCVTFTKKYREFRFRESDVVIATFPRCGTTWTQEIVWLMRNDLDFKTAATVPRGDRSPFLEFDSLYPIHQELPEKYCADFLARHPNQDPRDGGVYLDLAESAPSPRTIKTHLPFFLLPPDILETCKVVYLARNPRDVCVSYYHHQSSLVVAEFTGNFPDFVDFWCRDLCMQSPFWAHLTEAWARRDHRNFLLLFYEDMKENLIRELRRLNTFLGTKLTEDQLQQVADYTSIKEMKSRQASNPPTNEFTQNAIKEGRTHFIRKGDVGDWVNYFTPDLETKFEAWMDKGGKVAKEIPFKYQMEETKTDSDERT